MWQTKHSTNYIFYNPIILVVPNVPEHKFEINKTQMKWYKKKSKYYKPSAHLMHKMQKTNGILTYHAITSLFFVRYYCQYLVLIQLV